MSFLQKLFFPCYLELGLVQQRNSLVAGQGPACHELGCATDRRTAPTAAMRWIVVGNPFQLATSIFIFRLLTRRIPIALNSASYLPEPQRSVSNDEKFETPQYSLIKSV